MNDQELQAVYRRILASRAAGDRTGCVSPEQLLQLADGSAGADDRLRWMDHVAACPTCMKELAIARTTAVAGGGLVRRKIPLGQMAIAASIAALAIGAMLWGRGRSVEGDVMRGAGGEIALRVPAAGVAVPANGLRLAWAPARQAVHYDVEVLTTSGAQLYATTTSDTVAALPEDVILTPDTEYRWRVTALLSDGDRLRSPAQAFRVQRP